LVGRAAALGRDVQATLDRNDAYTLLHVLGDALVTGLTGTNVMDIYILAFVVS
jgi:glycerate-2-kinase